GVWVLHLNLSHAPALIRDNGVEQFRLAHGKQKKREPMVVQEAKSVLGKPDGIRQTDHHRLIRMNQRQGAKYGVAKSRGPRLDDVANCHRPGSSAVILQDVRFSRRNYQTDLGYSSEG